MKNEQYGKKTALATLAYAILNVESKANLTEVLTITNLFNLKYCCLKQR
jgi:hypothetical protein